MSRSSIASALKIIEPVSVDALIERRTLLTKRIEELSLEMQNVQDEINQRVAAKHERVRLTPRQREVLVGIQRIESNKLIAADMHITARTVKFHVSNMLNLFTRASGKILSNRQELREMTKNARYIASILLLSLICLAPAAPAAHAQQGPPSVTLTWSGVVVPTQGSLGYKVQRANAQAGPFATIGAVVNTATYADLTVTRGSTYYYQVLSSCPTSGAGCGTTASPINGDSVPSTIVNATIPNATTAPPTPTNLTITNVQ